MIWLVILFYKVVLFSSVDEELALFKSNEIIDSTILQKVLHSFTVLFTFNNLYIIRYRSKLKNSTTFVPSKTNRWLRI